MSPRLSRRIAASRAGWRWSSSAGRSMWTIPPAAPLSRTPPGVLARLVAETALGGCAAETLLALLKHPLAAFGMRPGDARRAARNLERAVLRGPRLRRGLAALRHALEVRHCRAPSAGRRAAAPNRSGAAPVIPNRLGVRARSRGTVEAALLPLERIAIAGGVAASRGSRRSAPRRAPCRRRQGQGRARSAVRRRGWGSARCIARRASRRSARRPRYPAARLSRTLLPP